MKAQYRNLSFGLFCIFVVLFCKGTLQALVQVALDLDDKETLQVLVVPIISCVLIWTNRKHVFNDAGTAAIPGTILMGLAALIWATGRASETQLNDNDYLAVRTLSLIVFWLGGFVLFYGPQTFRRAAFPLLFLFTGIPIPSAVLHKVVATLQSGSAVLAYGFLRLSGTPIYREGFQFTMPGLVIEVAPECSGIRSAIALSIVCLVAANLYLKSLKRQALFLLAAIPVVFFKNALRIAVLALLAVHIDKRIITSRLHQEGGIPFFVLGLFMMYLVLMMLVRSERCDRRF